MDFEIQCEIAICGWREFTKGEVVTFVTFVILATFETLYLIHI